MKIFEKFRMMEIAFIAHKSFAFRTIKICFFFRMRKVEYEYIITNGNVEISAIYAASTRKVKKQFDATLIKYICPGDSKRLDGEKFEKRYDYTSKKKDVSSVAAVVERDEKTELVLME